MEKFPAPGQASSLPLPPLHKALQANWTTLNQALQPQGAPKKELSDLQKELLGLMGTYRDVYMPECSPLAEGKEVRGAYCLHVLNHVLKANSNVLTHNAQLKEGKITDDETRDQGLTRPKVTLPFFVICSILYFVCPVWKYGICLIKLHILKSTWKKYTKKINRSML